MKDQNFGELWVSGNNPVDKTHIFSSIQTLIIELLSTIFSR